MEDDLKKILMEDDINIYILNSIVISYNNKIPIRYEAPP